MSNKPGIVLYTTLNSELKPILMNYCAQKNILCISVVENIINELSKFLGIQNSDIEENHFDESYFDKLEAIDYTLRHDDGNMNQEIGEADILLIGPSRSSKTPTSVYLAYNGFKTANIPYIQGANLPDILFKSTHPLIVGLIINPSRLVEIRETRMHFLQTNLPTEYTNISLIKEECLEVRRLCQDNNWPLIDVSLKSIEETAAAVMKIYYEKKHYHRETNHHGV